MFGEGKLSTPVILKLFLLMSPLRYSFKPSTIFTKTEKKLSVYIYIMCGCMLFVVNMNVKWVGANHFSTKHGLVLHL